MNKANRLHNLAKVNFVGIGDEPKKTFFLLVKAKQQREAMSILVTDEKTTIEDKGEIIEEIKQFYDKLYATIGSSPTVTIAWEEILSVVQVRVTQEQTVN